MTRRWVAADDQRWLMACDRDGCPTVSDPFPAGAAPDLSVFVAAGWFVARLFGDRCPACVAAGLVDKVPPYEGTSTPLPSPIDVVEAL